MNKLQEVKQEIIKAVPECAKRQAPRYLPLPMKYDGISYFWGPEMEMIADVVEDFDGGELFRIRGWGHIQYLKEEGKTPAQLQDECAYYIQDAVNAYEGITLEDVMVAIGNILVVSDCFGNIYKLKMRMDQKLPVLDDSGETARWKLNTPLDQQSEELIHFLHKLLCQKK